MIKVEIPKKKLVDWFVKYLLPYIVKVMALSEVTTEEREILTSYHLDFIYSWSRVLYEIFPNAP